MECRLCRRLVLVVPVLLLLPLRGAGTDCGEEPGGPEPGSYAVYTAIAGMDLYSPDDFVTSVVLSGNHDIALALFSEPRFRADIYEFYTGITGSSEIAAAVINAAYGKNIPFSLAFALMWAESGYDPMAVNRNHGSVDRGLFQLNSRSFPHMKESDFFDVGINVETGINYLSYCLKTGENEITALAIYNAGPGRVSSSGAPMMTLGHISKILDYRAELDRRFERYISRSGKIRTAKKSGKNLVPVLDRRGTIK